MKKYLPIIILVVLLGAYLAYDQNVFNLNPKAPDNSLFVIMLYKLDGTWMFDDARAGLKGEPFVAGIPEMIDKLVANIPEAEDGFRLFFSTRPFPEYSAKLIWQRGSEEGNWYYCEKLRLEGWLCPALFKYYRKAPKEIYLKAEAE